MLFSKFSTALWAFSALASATPVSYNALAAREAPANRGLFWTPRSLQTRNNQQRKREIIIAQPVNVQPDPVQIGQDTQLAELIGGLIVNDGLESARDNVRRNHYRNRNRRDDVNTIIIVVLVVVDARDQGRQNLRYLTRQVEANPGAPNQEWIVVTEQQTMTVGNPNPTSIVAPTAIAAPVLPRNIVSFPVGVFDPNAPLQIGAGEALLPHSIQAPRYEDRGARNERDPAIILIADQVVFVVIDGDNDKDDKKNDNDKNDNDKDSDRGGDDDKRGGRGGDDEEKH